MTTTSTSTADVASLTALIGYPPDGHACPLCGAADRDVFLSVNVARNGEVVCEACLDTTEDPVLRAWGCVVNGVAAMEMSLWAAQLEGADPVLMSHLARVAASIAIQIALPYERRTESQGETP